MALFGKKKADAPADDAVGAPVATAGAAGVTLDPNGAAGGEVDIAPKMGKTRKEKPPRSAKGSGVKSGTVVGLNIGNAFIKAVEVTSKGGQVSVTGIGVVETPPDSYQNGNVLNVTALTNALRTLWKAANLHTRATVLSVAGTGSLVVRVIEVPRMTDGELADNMRVDADRYIPFPPSEVVMDFKALRDLPSDPDAANMEVLLAAAQREIIDLHVNVVQKAKLDPRAIDVEPIAIARALQLDRAPGALVDYDEVSAVLNIGETGTEISILRGDIVVFTRSVPNGGGALTGAIAEVMGLPRSAAETMKIESGDALPPPGYDEGGEDEEDFGFGDFGAPAGDGGGDVTFDIAPQTSTSGTATAAPAASASDDPFDLDFFDQGGAQSEPGAGHGQREDSADDEREEDAPGGINFSFDKLDDDLTPSHASDAPPAPPTPAVVAAPAPVAAAPAPEEFELPDTYLPATDAPLAGAPAATTASAPTTGTTPLSQVPGASAPMPSAFDFSDFDLPTATTAPAQSAPAVTASPATAPTMKLSGAETPDETTVIAPATGSVAPAPAATAPIAFGFDDELTPTQPAPTEAAATEAASAPALSLGKTNEAAPDETTIIAPVAPTAPMAPAPATNSGDFDLDDLFGAPAATTAPGVPATAGVADAGVADARDGFDMGDLDFGGAGAGGDFDVSAIGVPDETDDFASFGTGLSQTGATDANTLYSAMQPVLDDLATEVRRSLEFHLGRYPDTTFSRLVLVGGGAKLRNLDEFLFQNLGVPTVIGNPFENIAVGVAGLPSEFVPTNAPLCAVALGLALRDFIE